MLPPIGMRIIKSAIAVCFIFLLCNILGITGSTFYSAISALWCMQPYTESTLTMAKQRVLGTFIGAIYGIIVLFIELKLVPIYETPLGYFVIVLFIILILYTSAHTKYGKNGYFACVVFLSITVTHITDANPMLFIYNRIFATLLGIIIGIGINSLYLPTKKAKDTLFIAGLDGTLLNEDMQLTPSSIVRLNRMLEQGMQFTIATIRTPASMLEVFQGIQLKLPIIAMDGAVLYDIKKKEFLKAYIISKKSVDEITHFFQERKVHYFLNTIMDQVLVIFYEEFNNDGEKMLFESLKTSPYRNYVHRKHYVNQEVVYIMILETHEKAKALSLEFDESELGGHFRVTLSEAKEYPGYSMLKIYNKNATKKNMIDYLYEVTQLEKIVTVGSIEGAYDIVIKENNTNIVVSTLEKNFKIKK